MDAGTKQHGVKVRVMAFVLAGRWRVGATMLVGQTDLDPSSTTNLNPTRPPASLAFNSRLEKKKWVHLEKGIIGL